LKRTTLQNKMRRLGISKGDYQRHRWDALFRISIFVQNSWPWTHAT